jgi:hypothetical protein
MPDWMIYALVSIASIAVTLVLTGWKGFAKGFGTKKGETAATQDDLAMIVEQMKAMTQAQKDIEAKISDEVLTRQKHRELKREAMFTAVKELAHLQEFLSIFLMLSHVDKNDPRHVGLYDRYEASKISLRNARYLSMIVCEKRVVDMLEEVSFLVELAFQESTHSKVSAHDKAKRAEEKIFTLLEEIRKELEMD